MNNPKTYRNKKYHQHKMYPICNSPKQSCNVFRLHLAIYVDGGLALTWPVNFGAP